jgi:endoglucanase
MGMDAPPACNITNDCPKAVRETPVLLSEFGTAQDETLFNDTLQTCLREYTVKHGISWMMWSIAGSYRIRSGVQGMHDTWGMTNFDWTGWNFEQGIEEYWKPWVQDMNVTKVV